MRRLLVLALFFASPLFALAPLSSLGGRVTTTGGAPLAGVSVYLNRIETKTDRNGRYWMPALSPGVYDVTFALAKHQTITRRAELHIGEQTRVDVLLEPSEEEEAVSSSASERSVLVEPRSVFSVDGETLNALPLDRVATALRVDEQRARVDVPLDAVRELAIPISTPQFDEPLVIATRDSGASVRATFAEDDRETFEAAAGGVAIEERLWLYGFALSRDGATTGHTRATLAATQRDTLSVFAHDTAGASWLHTGERLTTFATGSRHGAAGQLFLFANGHELSAGGERERFFVSDRVAFDDVSIEAVLRVDDGKVAPRVGAAFGRFAGWHDHRREEFGAAFAQQLRGGYLRATAMHRDDDLELVADGAGRWLLFTFGGLARYAGRDVTAAAWMLIDPPLLEHDTTIAVMTRYDQAFALDLAVTYGFARSRIVPFVKLEALDMLRDARSWRIGFGARL
ncbi:MAG TPA: carboxypeptidase-like regulatory domain-containing protein [Thermoanaerobaculia bacterium]|jgi:hypothetical protein